AVAQVGEGGRLEGASHFAGEARVHDGGFPLVALHRWRDLTIGGRDQARERDLDEIILWPARLPDSPFDLVPLVLRRPLPLLCRFLGVGVPIDQITRITGVTRLSSGRSAVRLVPERMRRAVLRRLAERPRRPEP